MADHPATGRLAFAFSSALLGSIKRSSFTPFVLAHSSFINRGRFRSKYKKMPVQVPSGPTSGATTIGGPVAQGNNGIERSRSLWVGELSFDTDEATLVNVFQQIGPLESVRICKDGKSKKSLGYAYVNYQKSSDAMKAADELNFRKINGKPCRIMLQLRDPKRRQNLRVENSNVVIKNLPRGRIEARGLFEWLVHVSGSRIVSCKIGTDRNTGAALGYAFAQFPSAIEAKAAIERINEANIDSGSGRVVSAELYKADKAISTVYIRGLPQSWTREEIATFFQKRRFGAVDSLSHAGAAADLRRKLVVERAMTGHERRRRMLEGRKGSAIISRGFSLQRDRVFTFLIILTIAILLIFMGPIHPLRMTKNFSQVVEDIIGLKRIRRSFCIIGLNNKAKITTARRLCNISSRTILICTMMSITSTNKMIGEKKV
eukprot:jgi/Bigna1/134368/aug1.25_g9076